MVNIGIFVNTPAQFHFYRNIAKKLLKNGNGVMMLFRSYGETLELARELGFNPVIFATRTETATRKIMFLPLDVLNAARQLKRFKPDLITGFGSYEGYTAFLLRSKAIVFTDSEPRTHRLLALQYKLFMPFTDAIITPSSFLDDLGRKQIKIDSYKELAYLHPTYYTPKDDIFDLLGLSKGGDYVLVRFNAFDAAHDVQVSGFNDEQRVALVKALSKHTCVFVSAEGKVPKEIENHLLRLPKSRIHDLLYYAKLFVTDTQTMATEAAILGTPTIRSNNFIDPSREMGNFVEMEKKYGLLINIRDRYKAIEEAETLVQINDLKNKWHTKIGKLDKIDITSFMAWFLENYPGSFEEMKCNPKLQFRFT